MVIKTIEVVVLGFNDLKSKLKKQLIEQKIENGDSLFEASIEDFCTSSRNKIKQSKIVLFVFGKNRQVIKF